MPRTPRTSTTGRRRRRSAWTGRARTAPTTRPGCASGRRSRADLAHSHPLRRTAMTAAPAEVDLGRRGKASAFFAYKRRTRIVLLLGPPMFWLVIAYLGAIGALLLSSLWSIDSFTNQVVHDYSLSNLHTAFTDATFRAVT